MTSRIGVLAGGALVIAIALLPWFALDEYTASGWDSGWLVRGAAIAAALNVIVIRTAGDPRASLALAAVAAALVGAAVIWPPDFGFGFDGLDVPVERRVGCWVGLGLALVALAAAASRVIRPGRAPASPAASAGPPRPAGAQGSSSS